MLDRLLERSRAARQEFRQFGLIMIDPSFEVSTPASISAEIGLIPLKREWESLRRKRTRLSGIEVDRITHYLEKTDKVSVVYGEVMQRVRNETSFLSPVDELMSYREEIVEGVRFGSLITESWEADPTYKGLKADGLYDASKREIQVRFAAPTREDVVTSLLGVGRLPRSWIVYNHEFIHAIQYGYPIAGFDLELMEVQAFRGEQSDIASHEVLVRDILRAPVYEGFNSKKVNFAVLAVDALNAMGLSQKQIVQVLKEAGAWDEEAGVWGGLLENVRKYQEERDLNDGELEQAKIAYVLKRDISSIYTSHIADEVLCKYGEEEVEKMDFEKRRWRMFLSQSGRRGGAGVRIVL